jgi:hypothetical protein
MRRFVLCCVLFALPAMAQLDSYALRAKYGVPLNRETYDVPQGFELTVDYGAGYQVCKLEVRALPARSDATQQVDNFLADLVPASMRGKELGRFAGMTGAFSGFSDVEYEHVTISQPDRSGGNETIQVIFKNDACR